MKSILRYRPAYKYHSITVLRPLTILVKNFGIIKRTFIGPNGSNHCIHWGIIFCLYKIGYSTFFTIKNKRQWLHSVEEDMEASIKKICVHISHSFHIKIFVGNKNELHNYPQLSLCMCFTSLFPHHWRWPLWVQHTPKTFELANAIVRFYGF